MSAAKHTPGPWAVEPAGVDGDLDYGARRRDGTRALLMLHINAPNGGGGRIGQCFANCLVTTDEELHANARLFAASPLLFDTLETLVDALTTGAGRDFIEAFMRDAKAALEQAAPGWNMLAEPSRQKLRDLANARAAAPEMLAALKIAQQFMSIAADWNMDEAEIDGEMRSTYHWLDVIRAAIAKAGEQP